MPGVLTGEAADLRARVGEASEFLKKLSNPNRLLIACALVEGERSVGELERMLDIRQPGLSQQLAELREAGLVESRKDGKAAYYRLADPRVSRFVSTLHRIFCGDDKDD